MAKETVFIGFDPREADGFAVARDSIRRRTTIPYPIRGIVLDDLRVRGMYTRSTSVRHLVDGTNSDGSERRSPILWDDISNAPMATEFSISRFLAPFLANESAKSPKGAIDETGLAVFMDSDVMVRRDLLQLFGYIYTQPDWWKKAVWCVKHNHVANEGLKMDGQLQTAYSRKNWSSVMVFNCDHPSNERLTLDLVNTAPGSDLHAFCWLEDEEIGSLPVTWNYLVGVNSPIVDPAIVHFTEGLPSMKGYQDQPYSDEWRQHLYRWAER
jgi:hypothetical protein